MTPGRTDPRVVDRHLAALRRTLAALRRHAGVSAPSLRADSDRRWAVDRGAPPAGAYPSGSARRRN